MTAQMWRLCDADFLWKLVREMPVCRGDFKDQKEAFRELQWVPTAAITAQFNALEMGPDQGYVSQIQEQGLSQSSALASLS